MSLTYHPDKVGHKSDEEQEEARKIFVKVKKENSAAYWSAVFRVAAHDSECFLARSEVLSGFSFACLPCIPALNQGHSHADAVGSENKNNMHAMRNVSVMNGGAGNHMPASSVYASVTRCRCMNFNRMACMQACLCSLSEECIENHVDSCA